MQIDVFSVYIHLFSLLCMYKIYKWLILNIWVTSQKSVRNIYIKGGEEEEKEPMHAAQIQNPSL